MPERTGKIMTATAELLLMERDEEHEARLKAEARADAAEKKYEALVQRVKPLLETIQKMEKPASEIERILATLRTTEPDASG